MNKTIPGLYCLSGLDADDLNIILPPVLLADLGSARSLVNEAIIEANRSTKQGRDGGYFEALQKCLSQHGIQTLAAVENLGTRPWDGDCIDVLGDMASADPPPDGFVQVKITNVSDVFEHQDDESLLCTISGEDPNVEYAIDPDHIAQIDVVAMSVEFPRSDRYGVPDCCSDRGGRQYLRDLGFRVASSVEVYSEDSGDDTPVQISLTCRVPREILQMVQTDSNDSLPSPTGH